MAEPMHKDGVCLSCGGMVDAQGYSQGGEVRPDVAPEAPDEVADESGQMKAAERLRKLAGAMKGAR